MSIISQQAMKDSKMSGMLNQQASFRPQSTTSKKSLVSGLTLTSLVDCFTILVVYLLVATTFGSEQIDISKDIQMPAAQWGDDMQSGAMLTISENKLVLENKVVSVQALPELLAALKKKTQSDTIILQADKKLDFSRVNPLVLASLQAGFSKVQFAVMYEETK